MDKASNSETIVLFELIASAKTRRRNNCVFGNYVEWLFCNMGICG